MRTYWSIITKGIGRFSRVICRGIGPVDKRKLFTDENIKAYIDPDEKEIIVEVPE